MSNATRKTTTPRATPSPFPRHLCSAPNVARYIQCNTSRARVDSRNPLACHLLRIRAPALAQKRTFECATFVTSPQFPTIPAGMIELSKSIPQPGRSHDNVGKRRIVGFAHPTKVDAAERARPLHKDPARCAFVMTNAQRRAILSAINPHSAPPIPAATLTTPRSATPAPAAR